MEVSYRLLLILGLVAQADNYSVWLISQKQVANRYNTMEECQTDKALMEKAIRNMWADNGEQPPPSSLQCISSALNPITGRRPLPHE
jgi:hypothetical protein